MRGAAGGGGLSKGKARSCFTPRRVAPPWCLGLCGQVCPRAGSVHSHSSQWGGGAARDSENPQPLRSEGLCTSSAAQLEVLGPKDKLGQGDSLSGRLHTGQAFPTRSGSLGLTF